MGGQPTKQSSKGMIDLEKGRIPPSSPTKKMAGAVQPRNSPSKDGSKRSTMYEVDNIHIQQHSDSIRCSTSGSGAVTDFIATSTTKREALNSYSSILAQLRSENRRLQYEDPNFPAQVSSISKERASDRASNIAWQRASNLSSGSIADSLFSQAASPADIVEGDLKNAYFTSALACLSERTGMIERLFESKDFNQNGCYCLWFCQDGEWNQVIIDDLLPCSSKTGRPAFTRAKNSELWVPLIEKAYAKMFGAYDKIESGLFGHALFDMTGAPYSYYVRDRDQELNESDIWEYLQENVVRKHYLVAASCEENTRELAVVHVKNSSNEKFDEHSYCILDAREVEDSENQRDRILKLRNPWKDFNWKGDWSQGSYKWTKKLLQELNPKQEGVFWMSISDFLSKFNQIITSKVHANFVYSSIKATKAPLQEKVTTRVFTMKVFAKQFNTSYITVSQKDKRSFSKSNKPYSYSLFRIMMASLKSFSETSERTISTYFNGNFDCERDVTIEIEKPLEIGVYLIYIEADWACEEWREFVLSAYSESPVEFQEIKGNASKLMNSSKISASNSNANNNTTEALIEDLLEAHQENEDPTRVHKFNEQIFRTTGSTAGYVYFLYENASMDVHIREEIRMKSKNYIELSMPKLVAAGDKVKVQVAPGDRQMVKYRADPRGRGEYSYSTAVNYILLQSVDPNNEAKLKQFALLQPSKVKQREMNGYLMKVFVHTFVYYGGVCFLYINKTSEKTYVEDLSLVVTNLKSNKHDLKAPIRIEVPPLQQFLLNLATIDLDEEVTYKPKMSFFLR